jgi:hypothetical protein
MRRKIHGEAHVDKVCRDSDAFIMMLQGATDNCCAGIRKFRENAVLRYNQARNEQAGIKTRLFAEAS